MARYFFHIDDGEVSLDTEGYELASLEVAKCEAVTMAGKMICEAPDRFWDRGEWTMTVADERGLTLFRLDIIGTEAPVTQSLAAPRPTAL